MSADQITLNLIAGVAGATAAEPEVVTQVLQHEVAALVVSTLLPTVVPTPPPYPSFGLTMEPDAITQMIGEPI